MGYITGTVMIMRDATRSNTGGNLRILSGVLP